MESVVKPVDSAKICESREDASGEIESEESETQRVGPEKDREGSSRSRKRRYSSEEHHRDGDRYTFSFRCCYISTNKLLIDQINL